MKSNLSLPIEGSVALLASFVYFVQGALGLSAVAFPLLLRQKGWSISEIATFSFVSGLPWILKLFYGALSDGVLIGGLRRKPYVILASLLSLGAWLGLALFPHRSVFLYLFTLLGNFGFALTDVVTDALIVEHSTESTTQLYQSLAWGFRSLGAVLGGVLGGWLAQTIPYRWIFALTALLPLTTFLAAFSIHESPRLAGERRPHLLLPVVESLKAIFRDDLKWFSLFMLVGSFSASFNTPFFFFLKEKLAFSETFLGALSSLTWLGAIVGCFLYGKLLRRVSLKRALFWTVALNTVNVLSAFWIFNGLSALILFFMGGIGGYLSLLPLMAAAAVLSRQKGIEGSLFALLMSIQNLGQILSTFIGGRLFDIMGLPALIFLSAAVGLTGFLFADRLKTLGN